MRSETTVSGSRKGPVGIEPPLAADQVVARTVRPRPAGHRDRLLQPDLADVADDLVEVPGIAHPRVHHRDPIHGDQLDRRGGAGRHHVTSSRLARAAIWYSGASDSNR